MNLGLYLGTSPLSVPARAYADGRNFRIRQKRTTNANLGWLKTFPALGTNRSTTKALLHFDRPDGATHIREGAAGQVAPYPNWTSAGNAQIDTAQFKFGGSSLLLDGTGDWVSRPDGSDISLGSSNFDIELQFNNTGVTGTNRRIAGQADATETAAGSAWFLNFEPGAPNDHIRFRLSNGSTFTDLHGTVQYTNLVNPGWHHVRVTRVGNTIRLFEDGVLTASGAFSGSVNDSAAALRVGDSGVGNPMFGWIDEFFMDIGASDYVIAGFTPPTVPYRRVLNGAVCLIENFIPRNLPEVLVVASLKDIYSRPIDSDTWSLRTPQYAVGTVDVSAANPAVVTVNTGTPNWLTTGIKPGDQILFFGVAAEHLTEDSDWYTIQSVDSNTQLTLTTAFTPGAQTNQSYTIRRLYSGQIRDIWDTDTFVAPDDGDGDDQIFLTNGVDHITTWRANENSGVLQPTLGFKCKQLRVFKSMMLYGNLIMNSGDARPTTFINSDAGKPLDVVNGLAGEFRAHDGVDQIQELEDLGDNMVAYSSRHVTLTQFVGDPLVFVFRQASTGIGPLSPRLVADFGDYHEFIGADSMYLFDGVSVSEVSTQVWREVLRQRDALREGLGFNHFDEENGDLLWCVPLTADAGVGNSAAPPEEAFVEHYLEIEDENIPDPHSRRRMPFLCGGFFNTVGTLQWNELNLPWNQVTFKWNDSFLFSAFPINLMGGTDGLIYTINVSQRADGVVLPSFVRSGRRPMTDTRERGLLSRLYPLATKLPGLLTVNTFFTDHGSGPISSSQSDQFDLQLPEGRHFVSPRRRGRFFECEFSRGDGDAYEIEGYDVDIRKGGTR